ncbi:MAG: ABC transporter substrate-binding protein [Myxococcales bacterium]|nr:ABC transporter substrate-binding protein [Myxococcales bacterium]
MRGRSNRGRMAVALALGAVIAAGCPRRLDPRAQELPGVRREDVERYRLALRALDEQDPGRARALAEPLARPEAPLELAERARYVLGVASYRLGDLATARTLLRPLAERLEPGEDAIELQAILADLARRQGQVVEALGHYERFYRGARPVEQAYIRAEATRLVALLPPEAQASWRQRLELPAGSAVPPSGAVGLVVPLSGRDRPLGDRVLRGVLLGLGLLEAGGAPLELHVRDSASSVERAAAAAAELAATGVVALIGSPARGERAAVEREAAGRGLLVLDVSLATAEPSRGRTLRLARPPEVRVRALCEHLVREGHRSVALLAPETPFGRAMVQQAAEALRGRVRIVGELTFPDGATTFVAVAKQLLQLRPEALLLPVSAAQLELIAAQLAASGVIPTQNVPGTRGGQAPPVRLVLSTAEGLGERLLRHAGRYLQGAVLAPISLGGLPVDDPALAALGERFRRVLGEEGGALDALAHDAGHLLVQACAAGAGGRPCTAAALERGLEGLQRTGATGPLSFDAQGQRSGPALLVRIDGMQLRMVHPPKVSYNGRSAG